MTGVGVITYGNNKTLHLAYILIYTRPRSLCIWVNVEL